MARLVFFALAVAAASALTVVTHRGADRATRLAAAEIRRYLADAEGSTGTRATLANSQPADDEAIVIATVAEARELLPSSALGTAPLGDSGESYCISVPVAGLALIIGAGPQATLYGAYSYLEARGFTFTSAGPTMPAAAAALPIGFSQTDTPVFSTRGLQPFHDFSEGPDWWGEDELKRVTEAIVSMKGNLIGFHTYPLIEPAVWVGLNTSIGAGGNVTDAYSTRWATTHEEDGAWGYNPVNTSAMGFGASQIFEHECFGHETVSGDPALCPSPKTPADEVELFNRVGAFWQRTFAHAIAVGVQTVLGTEVPLAMPPPPPPAPGAVVALQLWYSSSRNDHFITATNCAECLGLYVYLGTTGWIYSDNATAGSVPLCTYAGALPNGQIDNELAVCDPARGDPVRVEGYAPAPGTAGAEPLTQYVQAASGHHWAADAAWAPNATAAGFAAAGVIAQVLSTGPPVPSPPDAFDFYVGIFQRLEALLGSTLSYYWGWTPEGWEWNNVNISNPLIQDAVKDTVKMQAAHDAAKPSFKLASCGWTVGPLGARWYYDTVLPSDWVISSIDMDVGNTPVDPAYANITHRVAANKWAIPWAEDDPGLTAPELWVNRSLAHARNAAAYGVGGLLSIHWRTRMTSPQIGSAHAVAWNLTLATGDYWRGWAAGQFGDPAVASAAAAVFIAVDSYNLLRPVNWIGGPGGMQPNAGLCGWAAAYAWVDTLVALRPALLAAIAGGSATLAHLERFDYWAGQFVYMRSIARFQCDWAAYATALAAVQKIADPAQRRAAAIAQALPARVSLMGNLSVMVQDLLATVSTVEGSGTVYNVLSHGTWAAVGPDASATLAGLTGAPLPAAALPPPGYSPARAPQARVPVVRTMLAAGEPLRLRALVLSALGAAPTAGTLFYAPAGSSDFASLPLAQAPPDDGGAGVPRFVFTATLAPQPADFAWYVRFDLPPNATAYTEGLGIPAGTVVAPGGVTCFVPPGGAAAPQSVVIIPA